MKLQSAVPKLFVAIEMATVIDNSQRFDQSWIPPGQTTLPEEESGTTKLEPWLHEHAYIYSGTSLDFTDEDCHTNPLEVSTIVYYVSPFVKVLMY